MRPRPRLHTRRRFASRFRRLRPDSLRLAPKPEVDRLATIPTDDVVAVRMKLDDIWANKSVAVDPWLPGEETRHNCDRRRDSS